MKLDKKRKSAAAELTPIQCRMARAALGLTINDLATQAALAPNTVLYFEQGRSVRGGSIAAIRDILERAGAQFGSADSGVTVSVSKASA